MVEQTPRMFNQIIIVVDRFANFCGGHRFVIRACCLFVAIFRLRSHYISYVVVVVVVVVVVNLISH